jgi:hypothetical protein
MVFDLYFPLFAILTAYLIVGAITSVAAGILLGALLDRLEDLRSSKRVMMNSGVDVASNYRSPGLRPKQICSLSALAPRSGLHPRAGAVPFQMRVMKSSRCRGHDNSALVAPIYRSQTPWEC